MQLLEGVDGLGNGTTECRAVLVVLKLVHMAGDGASFVIGCRVGQNFAYQRRKVELILTISALRCGQMVHGILVESRIESGAVSNASSVARVGVEHGSKASGVFRG